MKNMNEIYSRAKLLWGLAVVCGPAAIAVALVLSHAGVAARAQSGSSATAVILHFSAGAVPGQTLRVSVSNPVRPGGGSARGHVKAFSGIGELIYQTAEADIPVGGFHSFNINRENLAGMGEPRTDRLQVRFEIVVKATLARGYGEGAGPTVDELAPTTVELIDNDSGKTTAMLLPAVQKVREAAARY
jgi:hypothetical protein